MLKAALAVLFAGTLMAQTPVTTRRSIQATGEATVRATPDQAQLSVGVITQAATAQEAASQNATQTDAVINQLKSILGAGADIKTIGYSLTPNYKYPQGGGIPTLTGYTASNTVQVTTGNLSLLGRLIDAANNSGANNIGGLNFGLRDPEPLKAQALAQAAKVARTHADAIANGLNVKLGGVLMAQEGAEIRPLAVERMGVAAGATTTPIQTGTVEVHATVTIDVEIMQ